MKRFFTLLLCCLCAGSMQAQISWGVPPPGAPTVTVDTTGSTVNLHWTNRLGNNINGFSPPRFYHIWVEELDAATNQWHTDSTNAHYFVSDTSWVADAAHPLGSNANALVRFRIVPYIFAPLMRSAPNTPPSTQTTSEIIADPSNSVTSTTLRSGSNQSLHCCIIAIIIDTRPAPTSTGVTLGQAVSTPSTSIPSIPNSGTPAGFANLEAYLASYSGSQINLKVMEQIGATTFRPFLYNNSSTSITFTAGANGNMAQMNAQLSKVLPTTQSVLKSASYPNYATSPVRIVAQ
jgi:hypothetical protein